jgi:hypothetical protein
MACVRGQGVPQIRMNVVQAGGGAVDAGISAMTMSRAILHITARRLKGGLIHGVSKAGLVSSTSGVHAVGIVATAVVSAVLELAA